MTGTEDPKVGIHCSEVRRT